MNRFFGIAKKDFIFYNRPMMNEVIFFTKDPVWRKIMTEMGAAFSEQATINLDNLIGEVPISAAKLYSLILRAADAESDEIIHKVFNKNVTLSETGMKIIIALYRAGSNGLSAEELSKTLGYADTSVSHAADAAVYQLRKTFGKEIIETKNGKYRLNTWKA